MVRVVWCWNSPALASTATTMITNQAGCAGANPTWARVGTPAPGSRVVIRATPMIPASRKSKESRIQVLRKVRSLSVSESSNAVMPMRLS